jgi:hypothetical protein
MVTGLVWEIESYLDCELYFYYITEFIVRILAESPGKSSHFRMSILRLSDISTTDSLSNTQSSPIGALSITNDTGRIRHLWAMRSHRFGKTYGDCFNAFL